MNADALPYPSMRVPRREAHVRRRRTARARMRIARPSLFLTHTAQHVQSRTWRFEALRGLAALANVVAWAGAIYLVAF